MVIALHETFGSGNIFPPDHPWFGAVDSRCYAYVIFTSLSYDLSRGNTDQLHYALTYIDMGITAHSAVCGTVFKCALFNVDYNDHNDFTLT